jgi:DnaA family protein
MAQLPLALALPDHASFATFVAGRSAPALEHVSSVAAGRPDTVWLWGARGSGKTHLLQAACRAAGQGGRRAMYVALAEAVPAMLADLDRVDVLALDDVGSIARLPEWQTPLFAIFNAFLGPAGGLLIAADTAPLHCGFALPDLASRAAGAVTYRLAALDDAERALALQRHAAARGLELDGGAAEFLVKRVDRDMATLTSWLDKLDRAALSAQRRLTIPFIRERLASEGDDGRA